MSLYPRATFVAPDEGASVWAFSGDRYTVKMPSTGTAGAFALMEAVIPPLSGPPLHTHHKEDEAFYIVDGKLEVVDDTRTVNAGSGAFVWLPRGGRHRFRNVSDKHTKILMFFLPGGFEQFFLDCGVPVEEGVAPPPPEQFAADVERSMRLATDVYGIE